MYFLQDDQRGALREAQLLSSLDHPNVIGYKETFLDDHRALCIVTTFCEEGDLFNAIKHKSQQKSSFPENEVMDMFIQIASGAPPPHQAARARGVVACNAHRAAHRWAPAGPSMATPEQHAQNPLSSYFTCKGVYIL